MSDVEKKPLNKTFRRNAEAQTEVMAHVRTCLEYWVDKQRLSYWDLSSSFSTERLRGRPDAAAAVEFRLEYEQAHFTWSLPVLCRMTERDREEVVCHELCHLFVGPMHHRKCKTEDVETVVTRMGRMLMNMKYSTEKPSA